VPPQITCPHCGNTINLENRKEVDFEKIINALNKSPKTFTELLRITSLPRKTLSLRLKELRTSGYIVKDGGYHLNSSVGHSDKVSNKNNGNGKMNQTILHIKKNVQWIPVALIVCLVVVAFGSAMLVSLPTPPPAPPVANFYCLPSSTIAPGHNLTFVSLSSGPITNYYWDFGDGSPMAYGKTVTHTYVASGAYTVTLTVNDAYGLIARKTETVDVANAAATPINFTPTNFMISPNPTMVTAGGENEWIVNKTLTFDASSFNESGGYTPNYSWNFGDGANGTGVIVSHAYAQAGAYNVTLSVIDLKGNEQFITQQLQIVPMPLTEVYIDQLPAQYGVGDVITLSIMISNVTNLYTWQAGMTFNSSVLQCITTTAPNNTVTNATQTAFIEGSFLKSGGNTWWLTGPLDNNAGTIGAYGCSLYGSKPGVTGSGVLFTINFKVIGEGPLSIHLTDVILISEDGTEIPVYVTT
jgi:PKD repeat protein